MLTPGEAARILTSLGVEVGMSPLSVEPRDGRSLIRLPHNRIAFFAASPAGLERLLRERRILSLIEKRCTFRAPRLLLESDDGQVDVREMVPGTLEPWMLYDMLRTDRALALPVGRAVGEVLAEQHTRISRDDVEGWLPRRPSWPESSAWRSRPVVTARNGCDVGPDGVALPLHAF